MGASAPSTYIFCSDMMQYDVVIIQNLEVCSKKLKLLILGSELFA